MLRWLGPVVFAVLFAATWIAAHVGGGYGIFGWILVTAFWPLAGALIAVAVAVTALWRWRFSAPMAVSIVLALAAMWPGAWAFGVPGIAYPASLSATVPALTVRLPSNQKLRVVWGGDALSTNYHALSPGQRWAYDLVVEPAGHGKKRLEDYGCFGTEIVAPIAGTVHLARDGQDDLAIGETLSDASLLLGNHVVIKVPQTGTFLVIGHMRKGSVTVKVGEAVSEAQPIGLCGNSGNTSEPHIHIHHQRQDPMLFNGELNVGVNYVEGLPLYFRDHDGAKMPRGGVRMEGDVAILTGDVVQHRGAPAAP
jgi:hypothetical protein